MIESMHDLGICTDVEQLRKQKEKYHAEIVEYCKVNPPVRGYHYEKDCR